MQIHSFLLVTSIAVIATAGIYPHLSNSNSKIVSNNKIVDDGVHDGMVEFKHPKAKFINAYSTRYNAVGESITENKSCFLSKDTASALADFLNENDVYIRLYSCFVKFPEIKKSMNPEFRSNVDTSQYAKDLHVLDTGTAIELEFTDESFNSIDSNKFLSFKPNYKTFKSATIIENYGFYNHGQVPWLYTHIKK
jgi:hypothetical protein